MRQRLYILICPWYWDLVQFLNKAEGKELTGEEARNVTRRYIREDLLEHCHATDRASLYRLKEFREFENYYGHLRSLKQCIFPSGRDYELYMRDILNLFDYYVRSGRLSRWKSYRHGGYGLSNHWRDQNARYSEDSFQELL
jgi:hypothetical protein